MDWFWIPVIVVIVCAIIFLALVIGGISRKADRETWEMLGPR